MDAASTINGIALTFDKMGKYQEALKYYNKCLDMQEKVRGKGSLVTAGTLLNIGCAYHNMGKYP